MSLGDIWGASDKPKEVEDRDTVQTIEAWLYIKRWTENMRERPLYACSKLGVNPDQFQMILDNNRINFMREWVREKAMSLGWRASQ